MGSGGSGATSRCSESVSVRLESMGVAARRLRPLMTRNEGVDLGAHGRTDTAMEKGVPVTIKRPSQ